MKKLMIGLGAVVVVLLAAVFIVPMLIPLDTYKQEIADQVEDATGRKLVIEGDLRLSVLPKLGIEMHKVRFANAEGGKAANMVELEALQIEVGLLPLISGEIEVDRFVLIDPVFHFEVDRRGRPNWEFGAVAATPQAAPSAAPRRPEATRPPREPAGPRGPAKGGGGVSAISLGDVRLVNGSITYFDARTGKTETIDGVNMNLTLANFDSAFRTDGSLTWHGEEIKLQLEVENVRSLSEGRSTKVEAEISSRPVKLSYKGSIKNAATLSAAGKVDLNVPSIRDLAKWAGQPLEGGGSGFGLLSIKGNVGVAGDKYSFRRAMITLDNMNGKGDLRIDLGGSRPVISARMEVDKIDLNIYAEPAGAAPSGGAAGRAAGGRAKAPAAPPPAAQDDWSDEPIDFSGLHAMDADLSLKVGGIVAREIKIGSTSLKVSLKRGKLVADLTEMTLYGGKGTARITINATQRVPIIENTVSLKGFQSGPFLTDAMDFDRVEGTANANVALATRGTTQRQMVSALRGNGNVRFNDGAIKGINLAAMARNVTSAFQDSAARKTQKTDFSEMSGSFTISRGILTNKDLIMKSPLLRLAGEGSVDLPRRRVGYRVTPRVVKSLQGQGAAAGTSGVAIPVVISGPWTDLKYRPDLKGVVRQAVKDPSKLLNELKQLRSGSGGSKPDPRKALKRLFGR